MHEVLVNHLVRLTQEKSVVRWTDRPYMTIAVDWDVKHHTKPNPKPDDSATEILQQSLWNLDVAIHVCSEIPQNGGSAVAQWYSSWLETEGQRVQASQASLCCGPWARHIYPSLVLVQPRKTRPCLTERLLMGRKESNQTNPQNGMYPIQLNWKLT